MKKYLYVLFVLFLLLESCAPTIENFWDSPDAYLGQVPPADTPKVFAPGILADKGAFAAGRIAFSSNGKELFYCQNTKWFSGKNLETKYFKFDNGKWNGPYVINKHYYAPTFSISDKALYFLGGNLGGGVVWQSHRTTSGWSPPGVYLHKKYALYDFMPTQSGNIYVGSTGSSKNMYDFTSYDICRISTANKDSVLQSLGVPVNTPGFNGDFFIAPDESFMIISYKETKDFECELYISFHKSNDTWTNPKSLGPLINDGNAHRWGEYVTPGNKYLFYTRGNSEKNCHIYWVRFDNLLERLKHTNFAPYVKNAPADQIAKVGQPFSLKIGDVFFDDDGNKTLAYEIKPGENQILPGWLRFNPANKTIYGMPTKQGKYDIQITAIDTANAEAHCRFLLTIN